MTLSERERAKDIAQQAITYIQEHPNCLKATSFADLDNYCDANVIGGQDIYLDEREAEIAREHPDWTIDECNEAALDSIEEVIRHAVYMVSIWLDMYGGKSSNKQENK